MDCTYLLHWVPLPTYDENHTALTKHKVSSLLHEKSENERFYCFGHF